MLSSAHASGLNLSPHGCSNRAGSVSWMGYARHDLVASPTLFFLPLFFPFHYDTRLSYFFSYSDKKRCHFRERTRMKLGI